MPLLTARNMHIVYSFYIIIFPKTLVLNYLFSNTFEFIHTNSEKTMALSFVHCDKRLLSTDSVPNQPDSASSPADTIFDNSA